MSDHTIVQFTGNVAEDPELRYTPNGQAVTSLRVIVNKRIKTDDGYVDGEPTNHSIEAWDGYAENIAETVTKGMRVNVVGFEETQTWEDRESGQRRYKKYVKINRRFGAFGPDLLYATAEVTKNPKKTAAAGDDAGQGD